MGDNTMKLEQEPEPGVQSDHDSDFIKDDIFARVNKRNMTIEVRGDEVLPTLPHVFTMDEVIAIVKEVLQPRQVATILDHGAMEEEQEAHAGLDGLDLEDGEEEQASALFIQSVRDSGPLENAPSSRGMPIQRGAPLGAVYEAHRTLHLVGGYLGFDNGGTLRDYILSGHFLASYVIFESYGLEALKPKDWLNHLDNDAMQREYQAVCDQSRSFAQMLDEAQRKWPSASAISESGQKKLSDAEKKKINSEMMGFLAYWHINAIARNDIPRDVEDQLRQRFFSSGTPELPGAKHPSPSYRPAWTHAEDEVPLLEAGNRVYQVLKHVWRERTQLAKFYFDEITADSRRLNMHFRSSRSIPSWMREVEKPIYEALPEAQAKANLRKPIAPKTIRLLWDKDAQEQALEGNEVAQEIYEAKLKHIKEHLKAEASLHSDPRKFENEAIWRDCVRSQLRLQKFLDKGRLVLTLKSLMIRTKQVESNRYLFSDGRNTEPHHELQRIIDEEDDICIVYTVEPWDLELSDMSEIPGFEHVGLYGDANAWVTPAEGGGFIVHDRSAAEENMVQPEPIEGIVNVFSSTAKPPPLPEQANLAAVSTAQQTSVAQVGDIAMADAEVSTQAGPQPEPVAPSVTSTDQQTRAVAGAAAVSAPIAPISTAASGPARRTTMRAQLPTGRRPEPNDIKRLQDRLRHLKVTKRPFLDPETLFGTSKEARAKARAYHDNKPLATEQNKIEYTINLIERTLSQFPESHKAIDFKPPRSKNKLIKAYRSLTTAHKAVHDEAIVSVDPEEAEAGVESLDMLAASLQGGSPTQIGPFVDDAAAYLLAKPNGNTHPRDPNVPVYNVGIFGPDSNISLYPHQLNGLAYMQAHQRSGISLPDNATDQQKAAASAIQDQCGLMTNGAIVRDITGFGKTRLIAADATLDAMYAKDMVNGEQVYRPKLVLTLTEELALQTAAEFVSSGCSKIVRLIISVGKAPPQDGQYAHLKSYWVSRNQYIGEERCSSIDIAFDQSDLRAQQTVIISTYPTMLVRDLAWEWQTRHCNRNNPEDAPDDKCPARNGRGFLAASETDLNSQWEVSKGPIQVPLVQPKKGGPTTRVVKKGWCRRLCYVRRSDAFSKLYLDEGHIVKNSSNQTSMALKALSIESKFFFTASHTTNKLSEALGYLEQVWPGIEEYLSSHQDPTVQSWFEAVTEKSKGCEGFDEVVDLHHTDPRRLLLFDPKRMSRLLNKEEAWNGSHRPNADVATKYQKLADVFELLRNNHTVLRMNETSSLLLDKLLPKLQERIAKVKHSIFQCEEHDHAYLHHVEATNIRLAMGSWNEAREQAAEAQGLMDGDKKGASSKHGFPQVSQSLRMLSLLAHSLHIANLDHNLPPGYINATNIHDCGSIEYCRSREHGAEWWWFIEKGWDVPLPTTHFEMCTWVCQGSPTLRVTLSYIMENLLKPRLAAIKAGKADEVGIEKISLVVDAPVSSNFDEMGCNLFYIKTQSLHSKLTTEERTALVRDFNDRKSSLQVMVLSYHVSVHGMNLHGASNHTILADPGSSNGIEVQAGGRLWRLTQQKDIVYVLRIIVENSHHKYRNYRKLMKSMRMTPWVLGSDEGRSFAVLLLKQYQSEIDEAHKDPKAKFLISRMKYFLGIDEMVESKADAAAQEASGPVLLRRRGPGPDIYDQNSMEDDPSEEMLDLLTKAEEQNMFRGDDGNQDWDPNDQAAQDEEEEAQANSEALHLNRAVNIDALTRRMMREEGSLVDLQRRLEQAKKMSLLRFAPHHQWTEEDLDDPDVADRVLRLYQRVMRADVEGTVDTAPVIDYGVLTSRQLADNLNSEVRKLGDRVHLRKLNTVEEAKYRVTGGDLTKLNTIQKRGRQPPYREEEAQNDYDDQEHASGTAIGDDNGILNELVRLETAEDRAIASARPQTCSATNKTAEDAATKTDQAASKANDTRRKLKLSAATPRSDQTGSTTPARGQLDSSDIHSDADASDNDAALAQRPTKRQKRNQPNLSRAPERGSGTTPGKASTSNVALKVEAKDSDVEMQSPSG